MAEDKKIFLFFNHELANEKLTALGVVNFRAEEIACKGSGNVLIDVPAILALQKLRKALGKPMQITSAYRSPAHNKKVGGKPKSYHLLGRAFDIAWSDDFKKMGIEKFAKLAQSFGFFGVIFYPKAGFVHIDTRPEGKKYLRLG